MGDTPRPGDELENAPTGSLPEVEDPALSPLLRELAHAPGSRLGGSRYTLNRLLGKGGMGAVYLAIDEVLGKEVALKLVDARFGSLERLRDEVLLAQEVSHRNVCRTYDLEEVEGRWLVKMEYVEGQTLAERVAATGRLSVAEARAIGRQIAFGLAAAHERGVVHRDLKPHNILVERDSNRVVLMDFGLARLAELAGQTADGVAGTPEFMAPEQARGREVDGRADLYALGCVLFYMLTGQVVFPATTAMAAALRHVEDPPPDPRCARPDVPAWLAQLILRLLEKDPARRPADAAQVAAALAGPPQRRRPVANLVMLVVAVAGVALLVWRVARPGLEWRPAMRELRPATEEMIQQPVFSPDGKQVAYSSDRGGSWRVYLDSLVDGSSRVIGPALSYVSNMRWTRDGRAILCDEDSGRRAYTIPIDGGSAESLGEDHDSPEDCGGRLLFIRAGSPGCHGCPRIVVLEAGGRERDVVQRPVTDRIMRPHCDAAGRRVVYGVIGPGRSIQQADIWIAPLDGGSPRKLASDAFPNASFHPDGKSVLVALVRSGSANLWELPLDGHRASQITFAEGMAGAPDVSPDGRMVVLVTGAHRVFVPVFRLLVIGRRGPQADQQGRAPHAPSGHTRRQAHHRQSPT